MAVPHRRHCACTVGEPWLAVRAMDLQSQGCSDRHQADCQLDDEPGMSRCAADCGAVTMPVCPARQALATPSPPFLADFLIAAHALRHADRFLGRDRGFYQRCFPNLVMLDPCAPQHPPKTRRVSLTPTRDRLTRGAIKCAIGRRSGRNQGVAEERF